MHKIDLSENLPHTSIETSPTGVKTGEHFLATAPSSLFLFLSPGPAMKNSPGPAMKKERKKMSGLGTSQMCLTYFGLDVSDHTMMLSQEGC